MKMECKKCGELFPEDTMIKITQNDYELLTWEEGVIKTYPMHDMSRHYIHVQICGGCYREIKK